MKSDDHGGFSVFVTITSVSIAAACLALASACAGTVPETRYYQLAPPAAGKAPAGDVLVLEALETETAYDDERIVYRTNPYRLDYYQYHHWSAAPGVLIGNYLEQAFERSGRFKAVVREQTDAAAFSLGGRVVAIEEVDTSKKRWVGRIVLELALTDTRTGDVVWREQFEETEPMPTQHPEGLARALSTAMNRIVARAAPDIADQAQRQARADTKSHQSKRTRLPDR